MLDIITLNCKIGLFWESLITLATCKLFKWSVLVLFEVLWEKYVFTMKLVNHTLWFPTATTKCVHTLRWIDLGGPDFMFHLITDSQFVWLFIRLTSFSKKGFIQHVFTSNRFRRDSSRTTSKSIFMCTTNSVQGTQKFHLIPDPKWSKQLC